MADTMSSLNIDTMLKAYYGAITDNLTYSMKAMWLNESKVLKTKPVILVIVCK